MGRIVACKDLDTLGRKPAQIRAVFLVASLNGKPARRHNFGNGAHADAANADNVNPAAGKRICHRSVPLVPRGRPVPHSSQPDP